MKWAQSLFIYSQTRAATLLQEKQPSLIMLSWRSWKRNQVRKSYRHCWMATSGGAEQMNYLDLLTIRITNATRVPNIRNAPSRSRISIECEIHVLRIGSTELKNPKKSSWNVAFAISFTYGVVTDLLSMRFASWIIHMKRSEYNDSNTEASWIKLFISKLLKEKHLVFQ